MHQLNVYVEEMVDKIPSRMLPIADIDEIKEAMESVQDTDDLYYDENGSMKVDEAWHEASVLDFGDWLKAHVPDFSESLMCYNLGDFKIIRDWMRYNAKERTDGLNDLVSEIWEMDPPTSSELAQAHIVADMLLSHECAITLDVFGDVHGLENIYIPAMKQQLSLVGISSMSKQELDALTKEEKEYWAFMSELIIIALTCVKSEVAVLSYTVHLDDGDAFGMYLFADGHVVNVPNEYYPMLVDMDLEHEKEFEINLSRFVPRSRFEMCCVRLASAMVLAIQSQLRDVYEHATKHPYDKKGDNEKELSVKLIMIDTMGILLSESVTGEYGAISAPSTFDYPALAELFQAAMDSSPFVTPDEATRFVVSSTIAQGACELLIDGEIDGVNEDIHDLFQELDFGMADIDIIPTLYQIIEDQDDMLTTQRELEITEEVFSDLPEEQQAEVDWLLANIELDSESNCTVLSLEGEITEDEPPMGGEPLRATAIKLPSARTLSMEDARETNRLLRQMCIQAFNSPTTTMFITSRGNIPNQVNLSAVQWKNGHWDDIGEEKAMFYIMSTDIGNQLDIYPEDDIDYRRFRGL